MPAPAGTSKFDAMPADVARPARTGTGTASPVVDGNGHVAPRRTTAEVTS